MATNEPKRGERRYSSHGRGGAGNMSSRPQTVAVADDLDTPHIKETMYTTGRGGSGNMAMNSSAEEARRAQDVDLPKHHEKEAKGTYHWGRGGEGNKVTLGEGEKSKE